MSDYYDNEQQQNKLTRTDYDKINEGIIRKNPSLGKISERVVYDREFLLEVSCAGYSPLDVEDIQNFLDKKPPKDINRNLKLCGADEYHYLGQGEYGETDIEKFIKKNPDIPVVRKNSEGMYLTDIPNKNVKDYLTEEKGMKNTEQLLSDSKKLEIQPIKHKESEETFRRNIARAFGYDDIQIKKEEWAPINNSNQVQKQNPNTEKMLELIKELRSLGFSPEEIKKEIQRFH